MTQTLYQYNAADIADIARQARIHILEAVAHAKGGHVGGPYSAAEMLAALYFRVLNIRPEEPDWPDRDRFVLSKGHSSIALYAILAMRGYFPVEELLTFDSIDSRLQGHPDMTVTPGVDMSSGSLGLGFAGALGMALGARAMQKKFMTYVMLGDGECNEGIVWEGAHVANRYGLDNLIAIVDHNKLQQFGWRVLEVDGHDVQAFLDTIDQARAAKGSPIAVIAHTIKGKGVSYMEGDYTWHSKVPTEEEFAIAMEELGANEGGAV